MLPARPDAPGAAGGTRLAEEGPATWQHHSSPVARYACLAYAALTLYASLYPWSGWRALGVSAWAYLTAPWPLYVTVFDLAANVLLYLPLGFLIALSLYPRCRGRWAAILGGLLATLFSASIEAAQTYLPERISSNVDLLTNGIGGWLGAALGARAAERLIDRGWLYEVRMRWFERDASAGIVIVGLWGVAQWAPHLLLFGNGDVSWVVVDLYRWAFDVDVYSRPWSWTPAIVGAAEVATSALGVLAVGLLASVILRPLAPRLRLLVAWIGLTLAVKALLQRQVFNDPATLLWLTEAGAAGLVLGIALAVPALGLRRRARATLAFWAIVLCLLVVNFAPESDYLAAKLVSLRPHRWQWLNFSGLLDMIAVVWPYAACVYLLRVRKRL